MILSIAEALTFLEKADTATDHERGLLQMLIPAVERSIKRFVGYSVEQASYTHYLPESSRSPNEDPSVVYYDVHGSRAVAATIGAVQECGHLITPEVPIRSVASVYEDASAYGGQGDGDFAAATLLTSGVDYWVDYDESGLCKSGIIRRTSGYWPSRPRTVKAMYTAGYTAAELVFGGIGSDFRLAVLETLQWLFAGRGDQPGPVRSEGMGGYSTSYLVDRAGHLPRQVRRRLQPFVHYARYI